MLIRESLPPVLHGEVTDLSPESRALLDRMAENARAEGMAAWLRDECAARLRQPNASRGVHYLLARAANGEIERAHQTFLILGDALAAAGEWEPLAAGDWR